MGINIGGGGDGLDYKPLLPTGQLQFGIMGCHVGASRGLNVPNPQPGRMYYWARKTPEGDVRARQLGYIPIKTGDREFADPNSFDPTDANTINNGGAIIRKDVILYWQPEQRHRAMQLEKQEERERAISPDNAETYLSEKVPLQELYEQRAGGRPLKFVGQGHNANMMEAIKPPQG